MELKDEMETEQKKITFESTKVVEKLQQESSFYAQEIEKERSKEVVY